MNGIEKDFVFSESVKAGKRIYYFDVKQSRNGEKYISITESKKIFDDGSNFQQVHFEKHKIFLYKEDYEKFMNALSKVVKIATEDETDGSYLTPQEEEPSDENEKDENLDIEFWYRNYFCYFQTVSLMNTFCFMD